MLRTRPFTVVTAALAAAALAGCEPDLGPCQPMVQVTLEGASGPVPIQVAANTPIYRRGPNTSTGGGGTLYVPYTAGQGIVQSSCGNAGVCHSANATGALRYGAPHGLDFDLKMRARVSGNPPSAELIDAQGLQNLVDNGYESWELIESGEMPPGKAGAAVQARPTWFLLDPLQPNAGLTPVRLPSIESSDGKELVRNWLACGLPAPETPPVGVDPARPQARAPYLALRTPADPIPADFETIHEVLLADQCTACHSGQPSNLINAGLVMGDACSAYKALINHAPSPNSFCVDFPGALVVPSNPDASLLYRKIASDPPPCGQPMPYVPPGVPAMLPAPELAEAVRAWIANGAPPPSGCSL